MRKWHIEKACFWNEWLNDGLYRDIVWFRFYVNVQSIYCAFTFLICGLGGSIEIEKEDYFREIDE